MEITIETIIITILFLVVFLPSFLMLRALTVYDYRIKAAGKVKARSYADVRADRDYKWRYKELNRVSSDEMVRKFWKPLSSFYNKEIFR